MPVDEARSGIERQEARIAWWLQVTGRDTLAGMDMILARVEVDFRSPASYREQLEVGVRCASLGRSSFVLEHKIAERSRKTLTPTQRVADLLAEERLARAERPSRRPPPASAKA